MNKGQKYFWLIIHKDDLDKISEVFPTQETESILDISDEYTLINIKVPSLPYLFSFFEETRIKAFFVEMCISDLTLTSMLGEKHFEAIQPFLQEVSSTEDSFLMERLTAPMYRIFEKGRVIYDLGKFYFSRTEKDLSGRINTFLFRLGLGIEEQEFIPSLYLFFIDSIKTILKEITEDLDKGKKVSIKDLNQESQETILLVIGEFILKASLFYPKGAIEEFLRSTSSAVEESSNFATLPGLKRQKLNPIQGI